MGLVKGVRGMSPNSERDVIVAASSLLRARLPASWSLVEEGPSEDRSADAVWSVRAADGREATLMVEAKKSLVARDVPLITERFRGAESRLRGGSGVVAARYLSPSVRERLCSAGLSYIDATGNIRVQTESPALFLMDRGADRDPWRGPGRPRGTLRGAPAAKVVRALVDRDERWTVRRLVESSGASTGSVYRVLEFLESESLATRDVANRIVVPDWAALLRRWSRDYQFLDANNVSTWISLRGVPDLLSRMRDSTDRRYAVTGSVAAGAWAPYAPARSVMVYTDDVEELAAEWGLRQVDSGANVLLAKPVYDVVYQRTRSVLDGLRVAAPAQVAVDLMTGPGRAPAEAEELVEWMERNEQSWR